MTDVTLRRKALPLLQALLGEHRARKLERAVYNWCVEQASARTVPRYWDNPVFSRMYADKIRSMRFNLGNEKNPALLQKIEAGDLDVKRLPYLKPWEMYPELWSDTFETVARMQLNREAASNALPDDYVSQIQCRKCKAHKVTYVELQTRAADEPMTVFAACGACQHRFKM